MIVIYAVNLSQVAWDQVTARPVPSTTTLSVVDYTTAQAPGYHSRFNCDTVVFPAISLEGFYGPLCASIVKVATL